MCFHFRERQLLIELSELIVIASVNNALLLVIKSLLRDSEFLGDRNVATPRSSQFNEAFFDFKVSHTGQTVTRPAIGIRGDFSHSAPKLLLWSSLCFLGLALNNIVLYLDLSVFSQVEINGAVWRSALGAISGATLLYGLIWELN